MHTSISRWSIGVPFHLHLRTSNKLTSKTRNGLHRGELCLPRNEQGSLRSSNSAEGDLTAEFSRYIISAGIEKQAAKPSPMLPPTQVVQNVMSALQRNNYPEDNAGAQTAYLFSKPYNCEQLTAGQGTPDRARSWMASESWLTFAEFNQMLHGVPYSVICDCQDWKAMSPLQFPSRRMGHVALQAVQVTSARHAGRTFAFTFCLERIEIGPYKGCWLVVGLREGDYASVL